MRGGRGRIKTRRRLSDGFLPYDTDKLSITVFVISSDVSTSPILWEVFFGYLLFQAMHIGVRAQNSVAMVVISLVSDGKHGGIGQHIFRKNYQFSLYIELSSFLSVENPSPNIHSKRLSAKSACICSVGWFMRFARSIVTSCSSASFFHFA